MGVLKMNKCIRCGTIPDKDDEFVLYEDSKNIYYGEYLCFDCNSMILFEWGLDKETQETMMKFVKEDDISVMQYVAKLYENEMIEYKNMLTITGDYEEAFYLLRNDTDAMEKIGDEEE